MIIKINKLEFLKILQGSGFNYSIKTINKITNLIELNNFLLFKRKNPQIFSQIKSKILSLKKAWSKVKGGRFAKKLKLKLQKEFFFFEISDNECIYKGNRKIKSKIVNRYLKKAKIRSINFLKKKYMEKKTNHLNFDVAIEEKNPIDFFKKGQNNSKLLNNLILTKEKYLIPDEAFNEFRKCSNVFPSIKSTKKKLKEIDQLFQIKSGKNYASFSFYSKFSFYFERLDKSVTSISNFEIILLFETSRSFDNKILEKQNIKVSFVILNEPTLQKFTIGLFNNTKIAFENFLGILISEIDKIKEDLKLKTKTVRFHLMANLEIQNLFRIRNGVCVLCSQQKDRFVKLFDSFIPKKNILYRKCFLTLFDYLLKDLKLKNNNFFNAEKLTLDQFFITLEQSINFKLKFLINKINKFKYKVPSIKDQENFLSNFNIINFSDHNDLKEIQKMWMAMNDIFVNIDENNLQKSKQTTMKNISLFKDIFFKFYKMKKNSYYIHFLCEHLEQLLFSPEYFVLYNFFKNYINEEKRFKNNLFLKKRPLFVLKQLNRIEFLEFE